MAGLDSDDADGITELRQHRYKPAECTNVCAGVDYHIHASNCSLKFLEAVILKQVGEGIDVALAESDRERFEVQFLLWKQPGKQWRTCIGNPRAEPIYALISKTSHRDDN